MAQHPSYARPDLSSMPIDKLSFMPIDELSFMPIDKLSIEARVDFIPRLLSKESHVFPKRDLLVTLHKFCCSDYIQRRIEVLDTYSSHFDQ